MASKIREKEDSIMRAYGWTHRWKNKSRDPYLKKVDTTVDDYGATYTDQEGKFRWLTHDDVVPL